MEGSIQESENTLTAQSRTAEFNTRYDAGNLLKKIQTERLSGFPETLFPQIVNCYLQYLDHINSIAETNHGNFFPPPEEEVVRNIARLIVEIMKEQGNLIAQQLEPQLRYNKRGGLKVIFTDSNGTTFSERTFYFYGNNGYIIFPDGEENRETDSREVTIKIYRGVGNFSQREGQKSILSRYNPSLTTQQVRDLFEGKINITQLIETTADPLQTRKILEIINETGKPLEEMSSQEILDLILRLHIYTERGGASFIFDPFISTSIIPSKAKEYAFPTNYDEDYNGVPGILIIEAPNNLVYSITSHEMGILMEIKPEWIKIFIPTTGKIEDEELEKMLRNIKNQA